MIEFEEDVKEISCYDILDTLEICISTFLITEFVTNQFQNISSLGEIKPVTLQS